MKLNNNILGVKFAGLLAIIILVSSTLGCTSSGSDKDNSVSDPKTLSEADYKAMCKEIPISKLTENPDVYVGQNVKYKGQVLIVTYDEEDETGKTATSLVLTVNDSSFTLESGLLPLYVIYNNTTDAFVYDEITIFGEVYGNDTFESSTTQEKTLPRVNAHYIEIDS
jgi:hypothetical protein